MMSMRIKEHSFGMSASYNHVYLYRKIHSFIQTRLCQLQYTNFAWTYSISSTRWLSWLRHCATSRKVSGSDSDGIIGIFN